jgi:hypothetical protein
LRDHAHADELNKLRSNEDRDGVLSTNAEVQYADSIGKQQAQYDYLVPARIPQAQ